MGLPLQLLAGGLQGLDDQVLAACEEDLVGLRAPGKAMDAGPCVGPNRRDGAPGTDTLFYA